MTDLQIRLTFGIVLGREKHLDLHILTNKSMLDTVRFVLTVTGPLQKLIDRPGETHEFCNTQAIKILQQDGFTRCATFFLRYEKELNKGVYWADQGWKNVSHFFKPASAKGLWLFPSATEEFEQHLSQAMKTAHQGNLRKAVFFLGAAAHLVQDLCVPHHALGKILAGHQQYETWVQQRYDQYAVNSHGIYWEREPVARLLGNVAVSADLLKWVDTDSSEQWYHKATEILLPLAQCTTAGLLQWFYSNLYKSGWAAEFKMDCFLSNHRQVRHFDHLSSDMDDNSGIILDYQSINHRNGGSRI